MKIIPLACSLIFGFLAGFQLHAQTMNSSDPTLNAGKVIWKERRLDLGEIKFNVPATATFTVENIGPDTLSILNVKSGCHCTTVEWTKTPVLPGQSGTIKATYDAQKEGPFYKIISVATNFDPKQPVALTLVGTVAPQPADNH